MSGVSPLFIALPLLLLLLLAVRRLRHRAADERSGAPASPEQFAFVALEGTLREVSSERLTLQGERDRAEARRREVERLHSLILGSIGSGVVAVGDKGIVRAANPAAGQILGCHPLTLVGRPLFEAFPAPALVARVEEVLATGCSVGRQEVEVATGDGQGRRLGVSISPMEDAEGRPTGAVLLFSDLTEVRRLQEEVEAKRRLASMGEMLAAIVHECRNGMGAVGGYARLLERSALGEGERQAAVAGILGEIGAIEGVLVDCLDYVRPRPLHRVAVELGALVREVAQGAEVAEPGASVQVEAGSTVVVVGDRKQLRQALVNLVRNAVQASPPGTPVTIRVGEGDAGAEVAVVDRGRGMSDEERSHLCDPFFTTRADGTGLGMSIVARILTAHGGQLEVESTEGEGTTVRLLLPVEAA